MSEQLEKQEGCRDKNFSRGEGVHEKVQERGFPDGLSCRHWLPKVYMYSCMVLG
jgi:hypothetical protein